MKKRTFLIIVIIALLALCACGKKEEDANAPAVTDAPEKIETPEPKPDPAVSGTYYVDTISGMKVRDYLLDRTKEGGAELEELIENGTEEGSEFDYEKLMILVLLEDGSGSLSNSLTGEAVEFTWALDRNTLILKAKDVESEMRAGLSGDRITLELKNDLGEAELFVFVKGAE
ncbi:MAG: hypothetical protein IJM20_00895 [Clostridia bacterium]|nr:hypothetical protein [Clostridia bacterium]